MPSCVLAQRNQLTPCLDFIKHDLWDIRLLGILVLLRTPTPVPEVKVVDYKNVIAQCWLEAKGEMLVLMSRLQGVLLYTRKTTDADDFESFSIKPVVDKIISQLPVAELCLAARNMLNIEIETEFACRVLGDFGTVEDLPYLHAKLNNRDLHTVVKNAMERIQERTSLHKP